MNRREFSKAMAASACLLLPQVGSASSRRIEPATHPTRGLRVFERLQFGVSFLYGLRN